MTDRDKLVDLLENHCDYAGHVDCKEDCTLCLADHLLADGVTVQKWIPVTERLPEEHRRVLCCQVYGGNLLLTIQDNEWLGEEWEIDSGRVTHWMPLPEPPKEGE